MPYGVGDGSAREAVRLRPQEIIKRMSVFARSVSRALISGLVFAALGGLACSEVRGVAAGRGRGNDSWRTRA